MPDRDAEPRPSETAAHLAAERAFWDRQFLTHGELAAAADTIADATDRAAEELLAMFGPQSTILDLGCGSGEMLARLAPAARAALGVDLSAVALGRARERTAALQNVTLHQTDGRSLAGVADGTIDLVYSLLCLITADAETVAAYCAEIARVLRPGGRAWLQFLDADTPAGEDLAAQMQARGWPAMAHARAQLLSSAWTAGIPPVRGLESGPYLYLELRKPDPHPPVEKGPSLGRF